MIIYKPNRVDYISLGVTLASMSGVTGQVRRFLFNGSQFVVAEFDTSDYSMELNYWNTNGTVASSCLMEYTGILDVCFDSADNRYYVLRWNNDSGYTGRPWRQYTSPIVFLDDFSYGHPSNAHRVSPELWLTPPPSWTAYTTHTYSHPTETTVSDTSKWKMFVINPRTSRLEYKSNISRGLIRSTAAIDGDFEASTTCYLSALTGTSSVFSMRAIDVTPIFTTYEKNNLMVQSSLCGEYSPVDGAYGRWQSSHVYFSNDSTSSKWGVTNLRLVDSEIDNISYGLTTRSGIDSYTTYKIDFNNYAYTGGVHKHIFTVSRTTPAPVMALAGGVITNIQTSFDYVNGPFAFTILASDSVNLTTPSILNGTSIEFNVNIDGPTTGEESLILASGTTGFYMGVRRQGTTLYARRDVDGAIGDYNWQTIRSYNLIPSTYEPYLSIELCASAIGSSGRPDLEIDNVTITSTDDVLWPTIPAISVETYDTSGNRNYIPSTTDADGFAINTLNVINYNKYDGGSIDDLLANGAIFAIATDHTTEANKGSVYILASRSSTDVPRLFKFNKSVFPLSSMEYGQSALSSVSGTLDNPSKYRIGSFGYSTCVSGELCYITDNIADYSRGYFFNTMTSGTLSGTLPRRTAWLQNLSNDYFAWNISDFDSLYGVTVTGTSAGVVRLYNMTSDTASFCNVVSSNRMLAASTNETSTVTAQVMNIYGVPLYNKTVAFSVSSGDGSVSPASVTTNINGEAQTTYTVGTAVTTSVVTATVSV
jgi:hypothetical protein